MNDLGLDIHIALSGTTRNKITVQSGTKSGTSLGIADPADLWIYDPTLVEGSSWFVILKPSARQLESSRVPRE
jgi:hypothetical protein